MTPALCTAHSLRLLHGGKAATKLLGGSYRLEVTLDLEDFISRRGYVSGFRPSETHSVTHQNSSDLI